MSKKYMEILLIWDIKKLLHEYISNKIINLTTKRKSENSYKDIFKSERYYLCMG